MENVIIEAGDVLTFPTKAHENDAAYDLYTAKPVPIKPNSRAFIPLGFKIELPPSLGFIIQARSGQSGKGMIARAQAPHWLGGDVYKVRINADTMLGLVDSGYSKEVHAIVKFGKAKLKHKFMKFLGFDFFIPRDARICQGRFVEIPSINLEPGIVKGNRDGLGSTDK